VSVTAPKTKIVCTLGPASATRESIRSLIEAGLNVARINFSHGTHEAHAATIAIVREVAEELKVPVAILGDLQGPRIRIGVLAQPIQLVPGREVILAHEGEEEPHPDQRWPARTARAAGDEQARALRGGLRR
jgi:pyruvate kinase